MGLKNAMKDTVSKSVSFGRWAHLDQLKADALSVGRMASKVFRPYGAVGGRSRQKDTFESCVERYQLTEADLKRKMKDALKVVAFCLALSVGTFSIMCFQFSSGRLIAGLTCLMLTLVLWAQAFREHFNYFQIKERRLGCTIKEWFVNTLKVKKVKGSK